MVNLQDAKKALEDGQSEQAAAGARELLSAAKGASSAEDMAAAAKVLVPALIALDKLEDAKLQAKELLAQFKTTGSKAGQATMLVLQGDLSNADKEPVKALDIAAEVQELLPGCGDKSQEIEMMLLSTQVNAYLLQSKGPKAMTTAKELRSLASKAGDKDAEAAAWLAIAGVHQVQLEADDGTSAPEDMVQAAETAVSLYKSAGKRKGEATALNAVARGQLKMDKVSTGLKTAEEALALFKDLGQTRGIVSVLETLVQAHSLSDNPGAGLQAAQRELAAVRQEGNKRGEADILDMLTQTYAMLGQPRGALKFAAEALGAYYVLGDKVGEGSTYHTSAEMQRSLGDLAEGTKLAEQSLAAFREAGCKWGEEQALQTLSTLFVERGFPEKAPLRSQVQKALKELSKAVQQKQAADVKAAEEKLNGMAQLLGDGEVAGVLVPLLQKDPTLVEFLEEQGWQFKKESTGAQRIKQYPHNGFYLQMIMTGMNFGPQFRSVNPYRMGDPGKDDIQCMSVSVLPETEAWQLELGFRPGIMDSGLQCGASAGFP